MISNRHTLHKVGWPPLSPPLDPLPTPLKAISRGFIVLLLFSLRISLVFFLKKILPTKALNAFVIWILLDKRPNF
jgi:hypothetical protein